LAQHGHRGRLVDDGENEPPAHSRNRVRNVPFGTKRRSLWVCNLREGQALGTARCNEVLRGESSPSRRSGIRKRRCKVWRGGGSRAILALRSRRARPLVSVPDSRARCASVVWPCQPADGRRSFPEGLRTNTLLARPHSSATRSTAILSGRLLVRL